MATTDMTPEKEYLLLLSATEGWLRATYKMQLLAAMVEQRAKKTPNAIEHFAAAVMPEVQETLKQLRGELLCLSMGVNTSTYRELARKQSN